MVILACVYRVTPELLIAVGTLILALFTAWMAYETRRTAAAATKALEFEQIPILGLRDLKIDVGSRRPDQVARIPSIRVGIELFNSGRVPVKYKVKFLSVTFANQSVRTSEISSRGGRVLPGASTIFWQPTSPLDPPVSTFPANGQVRFEYDYCDESGRQARTITDTMGYTVSRGQDGSSYVSNWFHVDEPSA